MITTVRKIQADLSTLILDKLNELSSEQHYPGGDPDMMDDKIKVCKFQIKELRLMRQHFEDIMTGAILTEPEPTIREVLP